MDWIKTPSSNKEDTTKAHWHKDMDLEAIPRWCASTNPCTLLRYYGVKPQNGMGNKEY
jgi:hypothetical protein